MWTTSRTCESFVDGEGGCAAILLAERGVTLLRGRLDGLEVALSGRDLRRALRRARSSASPSSRASIEARRRVANFGEAVAVRRGRDASARHPERRARNRAPRRFPAHASRARNAARQDGERRLRVVDRRTRSLRVARSLVADFAGARTDIAQRRKRGEASVRGALEIEPQRVHAELRLVEARPDDALSHARRCAAARRCTYGQHRRRRRRQSRRRAGRNRRHRRLRPARRDRACRRARRRQRAHLRARSRADAAAHRDLHRGRGRTEARGAPYRRRGRARRQIVVLSLDRSSDSKRLEASST